MYLERYSDFFSSSGAQKSIDGVGFRLLKHMFQIVCNAFAAKKSCFEVKLDKGGHVEAKVRWTDVDWIIVKNYKIVPSHKLWVCRTSCGSLGAGKPGTWPILTYSKTIALFQPVIPQFLFLYLQRMYFWSFSIFPGHNQEF